MAAWQKSHNWRWRHGRLESIPHMFDMVWNMKWREENPPCTDSAIREIQYIGRLFQPYNSMPLQFCSSAMRSFHSHLLEIQCLSTGVE